MLRACKWAVVGCLPPPFTRLFFSSAHHTTWFTFFSLSFSLQSVPSSSLPPLFFKCCSLRFVIPPFVTFLPEINKNNQTGHDLKWYISLIRNRPEKMKKNLGFDYSKNSSLPRCFPIRLMSYWYSSPYQRIKSKGRGFNQPFFPPFFWRVTFSTKKKKKKKTRGGSQRPVLVMGSSADTLRLMGQRPAAKHIGTHTQRERERVSLLDGLNAAMYIQHRFNCRRQLGLSVCLSVCVCVCVQVWRVRWESKQKCIDMPLLQVHVFL